MASAGHLLEDNLVQQSAEDLVDLVVDKAVGHILADIDSGLDRLDDVDSLDMAADSAADNRHSEGSLDRVAGFVEDILKIENC